MKPVPKKLLWVGVGIGTLSSAFVLLPIIANAIFAGSPPRIINTDDIVSSMISEGTIVSADMSQTTLFSLDELVLGSSTDRSSQLTLVGSSTATDVINAMASTTAALFNLQMLEDGTPRLGVGTSTPSKMLSVHGDTLITGNLDVEGTINTAYTNISAQTLSLSANLSASSTITQDGGHVLLAQTSGRVGIASSSPQTATLEVGGDVIISGALTVGSSIVGTTCTEIISTSTPENMIGATTTIPGYNNLIIKVEGRGIPSADVYALRFNSDAGTNYATKNSSDSGAATGGADVNRIPLHLTGTTASSTFEIHISNPINSVKSMWWKGLTYDVGDAVPVMRDGVGVWDNTTSQITTIVFTGADNDLPLYGGVKFDICGW